MSYVRTIIQAGKTAESEIELYLPKGVLPSRMTSPGRLTVQFGKQKVEANIKSTSVKNVTRMDAGLKERLSLPSGVPLLVRCDSSEKRISFGPLLGILLTSVHPESSSPFGALTSFMNELADQSHIKGGLVCALTLDDVDWNTQRVSGFIRRKGTWKRYTLPLPDCIYNRLASRHLEKSDKVHTWIQRCKEFDIPFFNEHFLNKWHVYQALLNQPAASPYLPWTIRYKGLEDLKQMLANHRIIYLKPTNGSMGRGIYRLTRSSDGYKVSSSYGAGRRFRDVNKAHSFLMHHTEGKAYILQMGLPLIGIDKRPTDFRVLVQKNRHGQWATTSIVARTGVNSVVSNVARGGTMMRAAEAISLCGPWVGSMRPSIQTLKKAAVTLAQTLEQAIPGHYAELGVDLGIDVRGKVWLLEINSKPSKAMNTLQVPEGETTPPTIRPSVRRLYDYVHFLGGFIPQKKR